MPLLAGIQSLQFVCGTFLFLYVLCEWCFPCRGLSFLFCHQSHLLRTASNVFPYWKSCCAPTNGRLKTMENETMFSCWISQNHPYSFCVVFWVAETCSLEITLPRLVWLQVVELRPFPSCTSQPGKWSWMCEGPLFSHGFSLGGQTKWNYAQENWDFWVLLDL